MTNEMILTLVSMIGGGIAVGVGAAAGYFKIQRGHISDEIQGGVDASNKEFENVWREMRACITLQREQQDKIVEHDEKMNNHVRRLGEIYDNGIKTNDKIDQLSSTLTKVLIALSTKGISGT